MSPKQLCTACCMGLNQQAWIPLHLPQHIGILEPQWLQQHMQAMPIMLQPSSASTRSAMAIASQDATPQPKRVIMGDCGLNKLCLKTSQILSYPFCSTKVSSFEWDCRSWARCGFLSLAIIPPPFCTSDTKLKPMMLSEAPEICSSLEPFHCVWMATSECCPVCVLLSEVASKQRGRDMLYWMWEENPPELGGKLRQHITCIELQEVSPSWMC